MSVEKQTKRNDYSAFTPEELGIIAATLYDYGVELVAAMKEHGGNPEFFRQRIIHLRAKILMQLEDARYAKQVLTAPTFDQIVGKVVEWEANHTWYPNTYIQIIKTAKGWEAEVWSLVAHEENEYGSNANQNT